MRRALKLLLCYLVASFLMTMGHLMLHPPHAHVPSAVALLFFPLLPPNLLWQAVSVGVGLEDGLLLGFFAVVFVASAVFVLRRR